MCDVSLLLLVLLVLMLVLETDMDGVLDVLLDLLGITFCLFGKVCVHQSLSSCLSYNGLDTYANLQD